MTLKRVCAWCQADLGEVESLESGVTHGICRSCRTRVESEYWLLPRHLAAGLILETENDHIIKLKQRNQTIALFTSPISRKSILQESDKFLFCQPV